MDWDPATRRPVESYRFLCSFVAPRPIAWITTQGPGPTGVVNAAPFSWYQAVSSDPPMVMVCVADKTPGVLKDTARNILESREFVVNLTPASLLRQAVQSSADYASDISEPAQLGLALAPSVKVRPPRLAASPAQLECRLAQHHVLGRKQDQHILYGEVVHMHADAAMLDATGCLDANKLALAGRMGGSWYSTTKEPFEVPRPAART